MSHPEQMHFISEVRSAFPSFFKSRTVLEVGSLDINGSVRSFFDNCFYIGLDVGPGQCVDIVCEGQNYNAPDNTFDTVISCECFEHNPSWVETFQNMHRLCKSGGLVIMTCATEGRAEHGTLSSEPESSPLTVQQGWNYYRNLTEEDFEDVFRMSDMFSVWAFSVNHETHDLRFFGIKK